MKKAFALIGGLFLLLLLGLVLVPFLFKDRVLRLVTDQASARLNATVSLGDLDISALRSFPDVSVVLTDLKVTGKAPFEGVDLAKIARLEADLNLRSLIGGGTVQVHRFQLSDSDLHLLVDAEGRSNTDVAPAREAPAAAEAPTPYSLTLEDYAVEHLNLVYDDQQSGLKVDLRDLVHSGQGDLSDQRLALKTKTRIAALTVEDGGLTLLKDTRWDADLDLDLDQQSGAITLGQSRVAVNALSLSFAGRLAPAGEDWDLDLKLSALETSFKGLLSLIPSIYKSDFENMVSSGSLALSGAVKGRLASEGEDLPAFDLALTVADGRFQVPGLPSSVDDVALDLALRHPGGPPDGVEIDLNRFHLAMAGLPLDGRLKLRHPVSDPDVDLQVQGVLDLSKVQQVVPMEGVEAGGRVDLDVDVAGRMSQFEAADLDNIRAKGTVTVTGVRYSSPDLPLPMAVDSLKLTLDPRRADLADLKAHLGKSDIALSGAVENLVPYALADGVLSGRMTFASANLDLDELSGDEEEAADDGSSSVVVIPKNLDLGLDAQIARMRYDGKDLDDVRGSMAVRDGRLVLDDLGMGLLGGRLVVNGTYTAETEDAADVDMDVRMTDFSLAKTVHSFDSLATMAPVAKGANGSFGTAFSLKTRLGRDLSPDLATLFSSGSLSLLGVSLQPSFLTEVGGALKMDRLKSIDLNNSSLKYLIENGRVNLNLPELKVGGLAGSLTGSTGTLDQTLDLALNLAVPVQDLAGSPLLGQLGAGLGDTANVVAKIGGTFSKPTVKLDLSEVSGGLKDQAKALVADQAAALRADAVSTASEELQKLLDEAKKQGDRLVAEAEKAATKLKDEAKVAGQKLRDEAKKSADKLKQEAKGNPLKEAAAKEAGDKLMKEADKKADRLDSEAKKKADQLVAEAKKQRDQLVSQAQANLDAGTSKAAGR